MATVNKVKDTGRSIPVAKDLMYKARVKYPGYDDQAALTLYMADQFQNQLTVDLDQNKVINAQKRENEKLKSGLNKLGQELNDIEIDSQNTDRELERLKQLSGKLKPEGSARQEVAKGTSEKLEKLEREFDLVKSKPNLDPTKYDELFKKVEELKQKQTLSPEVEQKIKSIVQTTNQLKNLENQLAEIRARETLSPEKYNELLKQVNDLKSKSSIDPEYINKIQSVIKSLETKQGAGDELFNKVMGQLHNTQVSLDAKEKRFEKYIQKKTGEIAGLKAQSAEELTKTAKDSAEEIKKYKDIVQGYKGDIDQFGSTMQKLKTEANKDIEEILRYNELMGSYKQEVDKFGDTIKNAKSVANARINKLLAAGENRINTEVAIIQDLRGELQQNLEQVQGDMATVKGDMATVKGYTDEIEKMINFIKDSSGYVAHQAYQKAKDSSSAAVKAGQQNTDQQNTDQQNTGLQKRNLASLVGSEKMNENQIYLFDDVKLTRQHPDPDFNMWLQKHIEYLVKIFKRNYKNDLARKNPTYGDQQIADAIEDNAEWINNWFKKHDDAPLTNEVVDIFLSGVKVYLWAEPVDTDYLQGQLFNSKVYENILDKLINETLNKER